MPSHLDALDTLDTHALGALAEPETAAVLALMPELDPAAGVLGLQELSERLLAELPDAILPAGVQRAVEPDGTRVFTPDGAANDRGILWLHGGGLVAGHPRQDDAHCAALAAEHGVVVRACTYRLAPQHPFPAGLDDCLAALERAVELLGSVLLVGASAGGGLAVATALAARDRGLCGVRGVVAYYPMLDDRPGRASMERLRALRTWHHDLDRLAWASYLPGVAAKEVPYLAAPARATAEQLRGLPPVFLDVGTLDGFLDEVVAFAQALVHAGVAVELCVTPQAWHASENVAPNAASSRRIAAARSSARTRMLADA
jgi:acetyl esterase/lipase